MSKLITFDDISDLFWKKINNDLDIPVRVKVVTVDNKPITGRVVSVSVAGDNDPEIASIDLDSDDGIPYMLYENDLLPDKIELLSTELLN